jgi:hypothetical protein
MSERASNCATAGFAWRSRLRPPWPTRRFHCDEKGEAEAEVEPPVAASQ